MHTVLRALSGLQLVALRGGGENALDAPDPQRERSRDEDDALVESLRPRIRTKGARAPKDVYIKAALALAREHESFEPDDAWWRANGVDPGCARTNVKDYSRRVRKILNEQATATDAPLSAPPPPPQPALAAPLPSLLKGQADVVEAEIHTLEATREAHLAEAEEAEAILRPLYRRLQDINHQRMMAAWGGVASTLEATGPTQASALPLARAPSVAASAASLSSEDAALHAEIDALYDTLPEFVYERNELERLVMGEPSPKRVSWCGHVYTVPRPYSSDDADSGRHTM